jgi:hypothetical protein
MSNAFTNYVTAVNEKYDENMFLGYLVWYTVSNQAQILHSEFVATVVANLDDFVDIRLPPAPRQVDVFKRACTENQRRNQPATDDDHTSTEYMIRDVSANSTEIVRILVRESRDSEGEQLDYDELVKLRFLRKSEKIVIEAIDAGWGNDDVAVEIVNDVESYFESQTGILTAFAIRKYIRDLIHAEVYGISVKDSGGVYFVGSKYANIVAILCGIIDGLNGSSFQMVPIVDDSKQREMLKAAFEEDSIGEIDKLIGKMTEILQADEKTKLTVDAYATFKASFDVIKNRVLEYSDLLDEAMETTASRLEIADEIMFDLIGKVKA